MSPDITANADFYRVDVDLDWPTADEKTWTLTVAGMVKTPLTLTYDQVTKMPATQQYATLECISNPVGGNLISNTLWTGVKLKDMLNQAGLQDGVTEIKFTCLDGYTESLPLESAMEEQTLLTYAMNGEPLPGEHGFPMRLYTPNRYGMKNPKWIAQIEAINGDYQGYWSQPGRNWDQQAIVKETAIIQAVDTDHPVDDAVPVGGVAFAGSRGITKVELAVDDGPWQTAELKPPLSPLTWTLWRLNVKAAQGFHQLRARTYDGNGTAQIEQTAGLHPSGASGYDTMDMNVK
jgi:DMSO/TMAO reductase YedYZ molybdopterin-dependent catalytic subunit